MVVQGDELTQAAVVGLGHAYPLELNVIGIMFKNVQVLLLLFKNGWSTFIKDTKFIISLDQVIIKRIKKLPIANVIN